MRALGKSLLILTCGVLVAGLAIGQQPFGRGGFGGGQVQQDALSILRNPTVRKELKITDEQMAKVPEVLLKALAEILDKEQLARFTQIELQQRGPQAFRDAKVQAALKLSDEQKEGITSILAESQKAMQDLTSSAQNEAKGGNFQALQGMGEKMNNIRKEATDRVSSVLTASQKKQWREMVGEELKLEFGGGAFGGKGGFKKKQDPQ